MGKLCNLDQVALQRTLNILEALYHAVEEGDFERIREEPYQKGIRELREYTVKMTEAGCCGPPHCLIDPDENMVLLESGISRQEKDTTISGIDGLAFTLLGNYVEKIKINGVS